MCLTRASFNAVRSFLLQSGVLLTDPLQMSTHAVEHFKSVLGPDWFQGLTPFQCSLSQKGRIMIMPTTTEITNLMFSLNPNKAPGPDGLISAFFKGAWSVVGTEVINAITTFFNSRFLPKMNSTILSHPEIPRRNSSHWILPYLLSPQPSIRSFFGCWSIVWSLSLKTL